MTIHRSGRIRPITSLSNPEVKAVRSLHLKKNRDQSGLFLAEGLKLILNAIEADWIPRVLFIGKNPGTGSGHSQSNKPINAAIETVLHQGGDVLMVSQAILSKIARRDNPQSVIGIFEQRYTDPSVVAKSGIWVALDRVRDPGNLGTIIRTIDATGVSGLVLVGECCDPYSVEAVRATMGAVFHVPIAATSPEAFVEQVTSAKSHLIGTHLAATTIDFKDADYQAPVTLLMGNEQRGISDDLAGRCDELVRIPMRDGADSLNLAISTSLMIYEALRKEAD